MNASIDIPLSALPQSCVIAALVFLFCILAWASAVDIKRRIVPGAAIAAGIFLWCAAFVSAMAADAAGWEGALTASYVWERGFVAGIGGALFATVLVLSVDAVLSHITGRSAIGMGDVELLFVLGLYVGFWGAIACLFIACALAALYSCARFAFDALMRFLRAKGRRPVSELRPFDGTFPFVPFLAAAYVLLMPFAG
ncbi:MAG: prepilin peptidase [Slackia sp.]|nr:prepilin peptidase [Slackia sp.]